ncbi:hypothetical protein P167DRAFT_544484 [Morchella conica CCBAS932]|uniref:PSP1 C-terminal domain-containing protein n=1 Tax=Morchella conica CCBAS932 TaxID=1392247 RepID=A0A3N4KW44_9PEZI|nr:hypothetical protein P167DRAFT_544484 [Morchella conica CCBAS932]
MSDVPSTNTPRLSDISSIDSPRTSLDHTSAAGMSGGQPITSGSNFNPLGGSGSLMVLDESRLRRASPDSDALVSSDEEAEQNQHSYFSQHKNSAISALSSRRPSYAAEFQNRHRTYSVAGGGPLSPTSSHPAAPAGDTAAWAAGLQGANQSLAPIWNSIWNSEPSRKSPPGPLDVRRSSVAALSSHSPLFVGSEALPSPTSMVPPSSGDFPIPIPLQPQLRNYRSMSFSVGQQPRELDERSRLSPPVGGPRPHAAPGLHHRPSRPSLLSGEQYPGESTPLRSVFETEDDDENDPGRPGGSSNGAGGYLHSNGVNATQQAMQMRARYESMRLRNRSASTANISLAAGFGGGMSSGLGGNRDEKGLTHEEFDSALADDDELDYHHYSEQRRFSEAPPRSLSIYAENQRLESLRRQHWQSPSGPFGGPESGSQSRRHSFAGRLPMGDGLEFGMASDLLGKRANSPPRYGENGLLGVNNRSGGYLSLTDAPISDASGKEFYMNEENRLRQRQNFPNVGGMGPSPATPPNQHHLQHLQAYQAPARIPSPPSTGSHRAMMGMPPHHAQQPRSQQLLYFVTFKAQRGDVFYVQEGTGLRVRNGDLVIVEADRGTDLGTVVAENITWQKAKDMKEHHAKEQYNWLMMFATRRPTAPGAPPNGTGNMHNSVNGGAAPFTNSGNTGAMPGAMPGAHGPMQGQEGAPTELKPKMIKRLAQVHEIQTLRDKEANEAKAKRVCQQKVLEHRLPMEILDAEFQMDWKKLTFYYFADSYINFNSLVTDLFKVYKTRIWMSAMNPASFAHPTGLHQPGSGLGASGALGPIDPSEQPQQMIHHSQFSGINQGYPGYGPPVAANGAMMGVHSRGHQQALLQQMSAPGQNPMLQMTASGFPPRHSPHGAVAAHQDFSHLPQQQLNGYNHSQSFMNGSGNHHSQAHLGGNVDSHAPNGNPDNSWMNLQGLSLNSH